MGMANGKETDFTLGTLVGKVDALGTQVGGLSKDFARHVESHDELLKAVEKNGAAKPMWRPKSIKDYMLIFVIVSAIASAIWGGNSIADSRLDDESVKVLLGRIADEVGVAPTMSIPK